MAGYPEVFILRRFSSLSIKSLLYYQAELVHLEKELAEIEREDQECLTSPRKDYATHWNRLSSSVYATPSHDGNQSAVSPRDMLQWQVVLKIRSTLREYCL